MTGRLLKNPINNQKGTAIFVAVMVLLLVSGFAFLVFYVATTDLQITNATAEDLVAASLAESGVAQVLSWVNAPDQSPDGEVKTFLQGIGTGPCGATSTTLSRSYLLPNTAFSLLGDFGNGATIKLDIEFPTQSQCIGLVKSTATMPSLTTKTITVDLGRTLAFSPLMTRGFTGEIIPPTHEDPNVRWNPQNPLPDQAFIEDWAALRAYIKRYGTYYYMTKDGQLQGNGVGLVDFDDIFSSAEGQNRGLVMIDTDTDNEKPIVIEGGKYTGYFYFGANIKILAADDGWAPFLLADTPLGQEAIPADQPIHLDGFFYTRRNIEMQASFAVYGAILAEGTVKILGSHRLDIWYNNNLQAPPFPGLTGLPSVVPLRGSWR